MIPITLKYAWKKVQKALCNIMEKEFISLFEVVFERLAETSITDVSQTLQDHFKPKMINYLSKDLYKVLVEGYIKIEATNPDNDSKSNLSTSIEHKQSNKSIILKNPNNSESKLKKSDKKQKFQQHISEKIISIIITKYESVFKNNICKIIVYSIY
ncbi:hypothetical protein RhiirC2_781698 [Rhizophagus irregularis]|uniref:Uncharacterized protein n=1 Tax=Rhizophagus irregularis TaxID=588596 RepID=A0A2N1N4P7_9GLOM|nr:hypothetical protein RhiirC2_790837 [Rhizophagus irregularis]PKK68883.1 hypothetical protein RhiirC2_781698 [Rhizophagus irregularis]